MASTYFIAAIIAFHLSQPAREPLYGHDIGLNIVSNDSNTPPGRLDRRDIRGVGLSDLDGAPAVNSPFEQVHPPVPYGRIWDNSMRQTAQQWVAILSVLQDEGIIIDEFLEDWPK